MFANLRTLWCLAVLLTIAAPAFSQTQEEIDKLKAIIRDPLTEKKPSAEVVKETKRRFEASLKARPSLHTLFEVKKIQQELELADYQVKQIKELKEKRRSFRQPISMEAMSDEAPDMDKVIMEFEKGLELMADPNFQAEEIEKKTKVNEINAQILGALLPHQLKRLNQIATQIHIKRSGAGNAILHPSCAGQLAISEEQNELISGKSAEVLEKLTTEIAKLREKTDGQFLSELTPKQRDSFKELKGEEFDLGFEFTSRGLTKSRLRNRKERPAFHEVLVEKRVMQDLELLGDQVKQFRKVQSEHMVKTRDLYQGDTSGIHEKRKTLENEMESKLKDSLLPHQAKRLQQIVTQIHIHRAGELAALLHPDSVEQLRISDEQKTRIKSRHKKSSESLEEGTRKLKEKADQRVVSLLDTKQRKLFKDLVGDKFVMD